MISHTFGGIYSDLDIEWKVPFDTICEDIPDCSLVLPKRRGLYFHNRIKEDGQVLSQKTTMIDDFVVMSKPGVTKEFLDFCVARTERKDHSSEPFSVYALTEWCLNKTDIHFLTPEQIYDEPECTYGYHYNKQTYNNTL